MIIKLQLSKNSDWTFWGKFLSDARFKIFSFHFYSKCIIGCYFSLMCSLLLPCPFLTSLKNQIELIHQNRNRRVFPRVSNIPSLVHVTLQLLITRTSAQHWSYYFFIPSVRGRKLFYNLFFYVSDATFHWCHCNILSHVSAFLLHVYQFYRMYFFFISLKSLLHNSFACVFLSAKPKVFPQKIFYNPHLRYFYQITD